MARDPDRDRGAYFRHRLIWLNSKTLSAMVRSSRRRCLRIGPRVVHDGMPDGVFDAPTPYVVEQIVKSTEQMAYREWLESVR